MTKKLPHTHPPVVIYGAMLLGLLGAVAFRVLTIMDALMPALVRPLWYFAVIGYTVFFSYRYFVSKKRKRVITENRLLEKIKAQKDLSADEREMIAYVLSSLVKSKENINYLFVVILSLIVLVVDLFITFS